MSTPDDNKSATQSSQTDSTEPTEETWEEKAAQADKRYRDTQSAYTKGQQALKAQEAENAELRKQLEANTKVNISAEDQVELDALMYEDPKAWREKMNSLEKSNLGESRANLDELTGKAREAAERQFELDRRQQVLKEFNDSAKVPITEELLAAEVPPRITNKLAEGKISFEEFLQEVATYVGTGKVVGNPATIEQPNMSNLGGGTTPSDMKPEKSVSANYAGDIY